MKKKAIWVLIIGAVVVGYIGWGLSVDSDEYRMRFESKFKTLKPGDTHQRMEDLLGSPSSHCTIRTFDLSKTAAQDTGLYEVYRLEGYSYYVEFPTPYPQSNSPIVSLKTKKPGEWLQSVAGC